MSREQGPNPDATTPPGVHRRRATPPSAFGEPSVWMMGAALLVCLALVVTTVLLITSEGLRTLWPRPIERITLRSGEVFLALPVGSEHFTPTDADRDRLRELEAGGSFELSGDRPVRHRFRVGNRDIGREPFRWVPEHEIASRDRPLDAVVVERDEWGVFIGVPNSVIVRQIVEEPASSPFTDRVELTTEHGSGVATQRVIEERAEGVRRVLRELRLTEGADATIEKVRDLAAQAGARRGEIERLLRVEVPSVQNTILELGWKEKAVRLAASSRLETPAPLWLWICFAAAGVLGTGGAFAAARSMAPSRRRTLALLALGVVVASCGLGVVLERPFARGEIDEAEAQARIGTIAAERTALERRREELIARARMLERLDQTLRLEVIDPANGRFAPVAQAQPDEPMRLSQAIRVIESNRLGLVDRAWLYLVRWRDFLARPPGESPGEGGVFPVIIGTVVLTLLLTVTVVPLGVVAALYLREYAHQGLVTSAIRIAINNLAGVPSIVYGMFGLGFFCYTLGAFIDEGPGQAALPRLSWWILLAGLGLVVLLAGALTVGSSGPGVTSGGRSAVSRAARFAAWWLWLAAVVCAGALVWTSPYFGGFFSAKLPEQPTFGSRGILWAALTLALLTLPVVIVATEEAIAAVPGSMREGSLGCGASRWQTVRRIVLPASMPGVLTGAILAMARGAGEVAPLMLVGAVNLAPALPLTAEPPFLHGDRTFMHLGFHIYNLGFQSPDAEAARPLVWTTTLLLVTIVLALNLVAMVIRARLPGRRGGGGM